MSEVWYIVANSFVWFVAGWVYRGLFVAWRSRKVNR